MPRTTRTEDITIVLREEVLRGQYRAGERLPSERDLAARFSTTRGVVRVALKKLEQLGVADVQPGGTRVVPLDEASLDVVGHMLDLESPPDPDLVDEVLEVAGALMAATARSAVERGDAVCTERARAVIARVRASESGSAERHEMVHELLQAFMDGSPNRVLRIVRKGLRTQILGRIEDLTGGAPPEPPHAQEILLELDRALEARDPRAVSEAMHSLWVGLRASMRGLLEEARAQGPEQNGHTNGRDRARGHGRDGVATQGQNGANGRGTVAS